MDEMDIDMSTSASSASEESNCCETALLNSCETCLENSWSESTNDELAKLKEYVMHERSLGEQIPLIFDRSDGFVSLTKWLNQWGPFPIHFHLIARIVHDISAALLVLHRLHFSYGLSLPENIFLDKNFGAHLLMEQPPRVSVGRLALEEDMFMLGETFYRLVTGRQALFGTDKHVKSIASTPYLIDQDALKLATKLLHPLSKHRPSAGELFHHSWCPVINPVDTRVITTLL